MKDMGICHGSKAQAVEVIVGKDIVYEHKNIQQMETEDGSEVYEYHEYQWTPSEWIEELGRRNKELQETLDTTTEVLDDLMLNIIPSILPVDDLVEE